jgi:hypothetical protein
MGNLTFYEDEREGHKGAYMEEAGVFSPIISKLLDVEEDALAKVWR